MDKHLETTLDRRLAIAPMLHWTDRYCRYFLRQISQHTLLSTEMITTGALLHRDPTPFLQYHPAEHPLALQLGGSDPDELAACSQLAEEWNYDEINLNVGCPSDRVQSGRFGACLMAEPALVAECVAAMHSATHRPVTVKHRIGIDQQDSYDALVHFVDSIAQTGCDTFIVHARKAWLQGLSPKQNREVPPLRYEVVHRLQQDFPQLHFVINGGFQNLQQIAQQLSQVRGVMVGREVYSNPWFLAKADQQIFAAPARSVSRHGIVTGMFDFIEEELAQGTSLHRITRHMLGLFQGQPGARAWRRHLSEQANHPGANITTVQQALCHVTACPETIVR